MVDVLEPNMLLDSDPSGIMMLRDGAAIAERIRWWAAIKKGDIWGNPDKGNRIHFFIFRPPSRLTFNQLEMEIANDLPSQVPIKILNISCTWATVSDKYTRLFILYQDLLSGSPGVFSEDVFRRTI